MIKLLLADDEPLALTGLRSMLRWEDYDVEICGAARNGGQALELIGQLRPDIVIADIRMPVKSGLEVMTECHERYGRPPLFILLTSFEEFQYVREAIHLQAVDYLVKLELTPESLAEAVAKAVRTLNELRPAKVQARVAPAERSGMQQFYDRFFVRLFSGMFDSGEQFEAQKRELGVDFSFAAYAVSCCEILNPAAGRMEGEKLAKLYASTIQIAWETVTRYMACYVTSLDMRHFCITFCLSEQEAPVYRRVVRGVLDKTAAIVRNYFSVRLACAVGIPVTDPFLISVSYDTARRASAQEPGDGGILFYPQETAWEEPLGAFDLSEYKKALIRAFEEPDAPALSDAISRLADALDQCPASRAQAMDAACCLLYMAVSQLCDGEQTVSRIFSGDPEGYRGIYQKHTVAEITAWIRALRDGVCAALQSRRRNYQETVVENVKGYIRGNLDKKLTLNEVAALFGFSANYLSQLFARHAGCSFVEFITGEKMSAAKEMLQQGDAKIYEIAQRLGFENAFYFSKVFKKAEGCSPREYMQANR